MINAATVTMIFQASALNRDEKAGGNIPTIKKLSRQRFDGKFDSYGYISKVSLRHHLFHTLNKMYGDDWRAAAITRDNSVIQFDMKKENILTSAELDAFGYMRTSAPALNRKSTVTPTKAVALESWQGDMQFNANHDLVKRAGTNSPNPVNKEEQLSYFKVSFTIDVDRLGKDEWDITNHQAKGDNLQLFFNTGGSNVVIKGVKENENSTNDNTIYDVSLPDSDKVMQIIFNAEQCLIDKELINANDNKKNAKSISFRKEVIYSKQTGKQKQEETKDDEKKKPKEPKSQTFSVSEELESTYVISAVNCTYDEKNERLTISNVLEQSIKIKEGGKDCFKLDNGEIKIVDNGKKQAVFSLDNTKKIERLKQILTVLKNGLIYHSSGENYGIVPIFFIASAVKLPMPIFHSFVELGKFDSSILNNAYIMERDSKKLIYLYNPQEIAGEINSSGFYTDWNNFLNTILEKEPNNAN